jgi:hypothetical protein
MEKRYQVFVSSTYDDLRDERREVMQALLKTKCIPTGMELFPAANDDSLTHIKRFIAQCDYYIVIVGRRYGSLGPDDKSFTERETILQLKPMFQCWLSCMEIPQAFLLERRSQPTRAEWLSKHSVTR